MSRRAKAFYMPLRRKCPRLAAFRHPRPPLSGSRNHAEIVHAEIRQMLQDVDRAEEPDCAAGGRSPDTSSSSGSGSSCGLRVSDASWGAFPSPAASPCGRGAGSLSGCEWNMQGGYKVAICHYTPTHASHASLGCSDSGSVDGMGSSQEADSVGENAAGRRIPPAPAVSEAHAAALCKSVLGEA